MCNQYYIFMSYRYIIPKYFFLYRRVYSNCILLFTCIFARVTKYSCSMRKNINHHNDFWRLQYLRSLSRRRETIVSQAGENRARFPVNRLGFPGIFSSSLFALYASCSFMFLGTNIAHHSAPYFLRRSYFCLLPASLSSHRGLHIRRKVVPGTFASKS